MADAVNIYCLCIHLVPCLSWSSYNIPLVADIHFAPTVALRVSECFDKIRVNPGNFGMHLFMSSLVLLYVISFIFSRVLAFILNPSCCTAVADRRAQFEQLEYTEEDYQKELEHIEQVKPFICWFHVSNFSGEHAVC